MPLAVTHPVVSTQILWASVLGALVFGEAVEGFVMLGGALIVAAVSLNSRAKARLDRVPLCSQRPETGVLRGPAPGARAA